jgi:hypothetical protein
MRALLLATMVLLALGAGSPVRPAVALEATSTVDQRIRLDWDVKVGRAAGER